MAGFTTLLLMLSCAFASHAATLSGFNYSSDHPALFRHEPCFVTNITLSVYGPLDVGGSCFSRVANIGSTITEADEDNHVVVVSVMPSTYRQGKRRVHRLPAGLTSCADREGGTWMMEISFDLYSYNSSLVVEMNQTLGRDRASRTISTRCFIPMLNSSKFASREKQLSNYSSSNLCSPVLLPLFPPVLQVQPIALVPIVYYTNPMCWPANLSFTCTGRNSPHRLLTRYEERKLLQLSTQRQNASWQSTEEQQAVHVPLVKVSVPVSALLVLICTVAGILLWCKRSRTIRSTATGAAAIKPETLIGSGPRRFSYSELAAATDSFAEEKKIGRGGFGPVYRGCLQADDRRLHVAIKVLSREQSAQGAREFRAEVVVMSQLRHRNIVRLVGWCDDRRRGLLLVYEFVAGGSLHTHLYSPDTHLTWAQRYKIALGLGSALLYLHTDCDQCVVHGDIKPANVMLDASRDAAKLGDFGLARLVDHGAEPQTTQLVAGTVGYIDPELVDTRRPATDSDVYSFGVVLLEIACGRRPTATAMPLLAIVRDMYDRGVILDAADPRLDGEFDELEMERLLVTGLWCAHRDPARRPSIAQAMDVLRSPDGRLPVLEATTRGGSATQVRYWEAQAYGGDSSDEVSSDDSSLLYASSTATAYLTPEDSTYLLAEE